MTNFERFTAALQELCREHGVRLTPSDYDRLQVWDAEGDAAGVDLDGIEDCTLDASRDDMSLGMPRGVDVIDGDTGERLNAAGHVVCRHDGSGEVEVMAGVSASGGVERETLHFQRSAAEFNEHGRMCAVRLYKIGGELTEPHDPDRNTA